MMKIKDIVKDNYVEFHSFRIDTFYYSIPLIEDESRTVYTFPVPINEIGSGTLLARDKALFYMRWIRKAIEDKTFVKL